MAIAFSRTSLSSRHRTVFERTGWLFVLLFCLSSPGYAETQGVRNWLVVEDSEGTRIYSYCVAPLYVRKIRREEDPHYYFQWPASVTETSGLDAIRTKDATLIPTPVWIFEVGDSIYYIKLLILKKGYEPQLWELRYDNRYPMTVRLRTGNSEPTVARILEGQFDQDAIRDTYRLRNDAWRDWPVLIKYTDGDRTLLRTCYYGNENAPQNSKPPGAQ